MSNTREQYRTMVQVGGKKQFTLEKMLEYGFWPEDLPIPFEIQNNETPEEFAERQKVTALFLESKKGMEELQKELSQLNQKINELNVKLSTVSDAEVIRRAVTRSIHEESVERRAKLKEERARLKQENHERWLQNKKENIVYIGRGYSRYLGDKTTNTTQLDQLCLPVIHTDRELADFLNLSYAELRSMAYHRDVTTYDYYCRFEIPKKRGGMRQLATPSPQLKQAQRVILDKILYQIPIDENAHGFLKKHSVITNAKAHTSMPALLITIDLEDFFPTITFGRVRGLFSSFGYSPFIASLLAMLCTYCERMPIEKNGKIYYVKLSNRVLPQGAPTSPMISNIICQNLDQKMHAWAVDHSAIYSRYADDISISFKNAVERTEFSPMLFDIQSIVSREGFRLNKAKTKFLHPNQRQAITGIVINNEDITIPKKWRKQFRAAVHNAQKEKTNGSLSYEKHMEIQGMLTWLESVNSVRYQKMILEAKNLLST